MPICVELPVRTVADLTIVELRLRELQRASTGVPCQALLTTEYLFWRHEVTKQLQGTEPRCVEAFIHGFYLLYERNLCSVSQILPSVVLTLDADTHIPNLRKRKAPSPETISVSLDI